MAFLAKKINAVDIFKHDATCCVVTVVVVVAAATATQNARKLAHAHTHTHTRTVTHTHVHSAALKCRLTYEFAACCDVATQTKNTEKTCVLRRQMTARVCAIVVVVVLAEAEVLQSRR